MKRKNSFFKKVLTSIYDMDAFSEYAKEGVRKSILYGILLSFLLGGIQGIISGYSFYNQIKDVNYELREYKDDIFIQNGTLNISKSPIKIEQNSGQVIYIDSEKTIKEENGVSTSGVDSYVSLAALKDGVVIYTPIDKYKITYDELFDAETLNGDSLLQMIINTEIAFIFSTIISIIAGTIFDLFFNCLIVVTIASFISILMKMVVRYNVLWALAIYASTLPLIVVTILKVINNEVNFNTTFIAGTLTYVVLILRYIKNQIIRKMNMRDF